MIVESGTILNYRYDRIDFNQIQYLHVHILFDDARVHTENGLVIFTTLI